jgi:hypothetical protein
VLETFPFKNGCVRNLQFQGITVGMFRLETFIRVAPQEFPFKNECLTNLQFQGDNVGMFRLEIFVRVAPQEFPFEFANTIFQGTK